MYGVGQEVTGAGEYWNDGFRGQGVDVALIDSGVLRSTQLHAPAPGTGSLDASRGTGRLVADGIALDGEKDIFGRAFTSSTWAPQAAAGLTWTGGTWNANRWSGDVWAANRWSAGTWSANRWSGSAWSAQVWSANRWSANRWSGDGWTANRWSGAGWSANRWSTGAYR